MGCPPGQACHAYCFLPIFAHGSLLYTVSRFTHYTCIILQGFAALNTFHSIPVPFVAATYSPPAAHIGSPAVRHRLRGCHGFWNHLSPFLRLSLESWFLTPGSVLQTKNPAGPLLQAIAIPHPHPSEFPGMAPVAQLADGSSLTKQNGRKNIAPVLFL